MEPTTEQTQQISVLSDLVLYAEAVVFIRRFVEGQQPAQLPPAIASLQRILGDEPHDLPHTTQVVGLLNIANAATYGELTRYIVHQRSRTWTGSRKDTKPFYDALERYFVDMRRQRLKDEFHLISEGLTSRDVNQQSDQLMLLLAREFIQHLAAEHGLVATGN